MKKETKTETKQPKKSMNHYVGERVRAARLKEQMTTTLLAEKMVISQAQVSRLETGRQGWRMKQLVKVSGILGVPVSVLTAPMNAKELTILYTNKHSKVWVV